MKPTVAFAFPLPPTPTGGPPTRDLIDALNQLNFWAEQLAGKTPETIDPSALWSFIGALQRIQVYHPAWVAGLPLDDQELIAVALVNPLAQFESPIRH